MIFYDFYGRYKDKLSSWNVLISDLFIDFLIEKWSIENEKQKNEKITHRNTLSLILCVTYYFKPIFVRFDS